MDAAKRGVGRPGKGDRRVVAFRLAPEKIETIRELATTEGFEYVSEWLAQVVTERIDNTDPTKIRRQV